MQERVVQFERVVGKPRSWKDLKSEVGKFLFKLERAKQSLKEPNEVGNNRAKLKIVSDVGMFQCDWKFLMNFVTCHESWKVSVHFIIESYQN